MSGDAKHHGFGARTAPNRSRVVKTADSSTGLREQNGWLHKRVEEENKEQRRAGRQATEKSKKKRTLGGPVAV